MEYDDDDDSLFLQAENRNPCSDVLKSQFRHSWLLDSLLVEFVELFVNDHSPLARHKVAIVILHIHEVINACDFYRMKECEQLLVVRGGLRVCGVLGQCSVRGHRALKVWWGEC
jgi:hypothetical protein